jgi:hypothetical protein
MPKMSHEDMLAELQSYVMTWDEEVHDEQPETGLSWQVVLLPVFADAGVAIEITNDVYFRNEVYFIDMENGVATQVDEDLAIRELLAQLRNASKAQVARYHAWASAMIERE